MKQLEWELVQHIRLNADTYREKENISFHFPVKGKHFAENVVRLLIVGRATNGWGFNRLTEIDSADDIQEMTYSSWKDGDGYSDLEACVMNRSPFWQASKEINSHLSGCDATPIWYESIAWANLCMAAPSSSGNPSGKLCTQQRKYCRGILKTWIQQNEPTHILFMTGDKGWFEWFNEGGKPHVNALEYQPKAYTSNEYVRRIGMIGAAKVVVANRPDSRRKGSRKTDFIKYAISAFELI